MDKTNNQNIKDKVGKRIVVIGGGAAGFFAAFAAAEKGRPVTIIEKNERVLRKLLATGNGRCNFTNINGADISRYHGQDASFAKTALEAFPPGSIIDYFRKIGIPSVTEDEGKVFPMSRQAASVVDMFRLYAQSLGIEILTGSAVGLIKRSRSGFTLDLAKRQINADRVIIATGGMAAPDLGGSPAGLDLLKSLSHTIISPNPALCALKAEKADISGLSGAKTVSFVTAYSGARRVASAKGELLFTDYGVSGSVVFSLSHIKPYHNDIKLSCDLMPDIPKAELARLLEDRAGLSHIPAASLLLGILPKAIAQKIMSGAKGKAAEDIASMIKSYQVRIKGAMGFRAAQAMAGGVSTDEFDPQTMESRLMQGLFVCGEALDIVGECGGYNLTWAFASGRAAGLYSAKS